MIIVPISETNNTTDFYNLGLPYLYQGFFPVSPLFWAPFVRSTFRHPELVNYVKTLSLSTRPHFHFSDRGGFQATGMSHTSGILMDQKPAMQRLMDLRVIGQKFLAMDDGKKARRAVYGTTLTTAATPSTEVGGVSTTENGSRSLRFLRAMLTRNKPEPPVVIETQVVSTITCPLNFTLTNASIFRPDQNHHQRQPKQLSKTYSTESTKPQSHSSSTNSPISTQSISPLNQGPTLKHRSTIKLNY